MADSKRVPTMKEPSQVGRSGETGQSSQPSQFGRPNLEKSGISFDRVNFMYNQEPILADITLHIPKHSFTLIVGPNGAGKTTFLRLAAGLLSPAGGTVTIDGLPVSQAQQQGMLHIVPQIYNKNTAQFPATVGEIVNLGLQLQRKVSRAEKAAAVTYALTLVGMEGYADRRIGDLSGGQQQRVMIAQALARRPAYLLLDEPTSGIDYGASAHVMAMLRRLQQEESMTIVMVTHDVEDAVQVADQVVCIDRHVCYHGDCGGFMDTHFRTALAWHVGG